MKEIYLYNTESRKKEAFSTTGCGSAAKKVGMYACGPTVYNYAHIGNMRTYIFEDVLRRAFEYCGFSVEHVMNITDVGHLASDGDSGDDKMEKGAAREGKSVWDIADFYTEAFFRNSDDLKILRPTIIPKATEHIQEMIDMVQKLIDKGFTYTTEDGIYFDTSKFPAYAKFAKLDIENLQEGHRIEIGDKKHKTDFALWKFSPKNEKRAMEWESPWGTGFPGWHIECSAMSLKYLPQPIDIHCGGIDHIPIHHTNEIAQVEAATGKKFCRFWIHGEFLVIDSGKMSKSGSNFVTVDSLKQINIDPLAFRYFCYSSHYRKQLSFSIENVQGAETGLNNLRALARKTVNAEAADNVEEVLKKFYSAVLDDMNMPVAMAEIWGILKNSEIPDSIKKAVVQKADEILALDLFREVKTEEKIIDGIVFVGFSETDDLQKIVDLLKERTQAKTDKNWVKADEIRNEIQNLGVEIADKKDGITCTKK
jgi:cysteinyl-tRNA synthetase